MPDEPDDQPRCQYCGLTDCVTMVIAAPIGSSTRFCPGPRPVDPTDLAVIATEYLEVKDRFRQADGEPADVLSEKLTTIEQTHFSGLARAFLALSVKPSAGPGRD